MTVRAHWFGLLPLIYFAVITPTGFVRRRWRTKYPQVSIDRSLDTYWAERILDPAPKPKSLKKA